MSTIDLSVRDAGSPGVVDVDIIPSDTSEVTLYRAASTFGNGSRSVTEVGTYTGETVTTLYNQPQNTWLEYFAVSATGISDIEKVYTRTTTPHYGLTLSQESADSEVVLGTAAFRLKMTASNPVNMSEKVFLYQREPFSAVGSDYRDVFIAVCQPGDLAAYPEDAPQTGIEFPFFRKSFVDLIERNGELLQETAQAIRSDVEALIRALEYARQLNQDATYTFDAGEGDESSSSSMTA